MMRGGHLDVCVLGAFQVSRDGDLANWHTGAADAIPAVGGAMDLAIGAKSVFVMMNLFAKDGKPKLVPQCTYPLTGTRCVSRVYTDHAVFAIDSGDNGGIRVLETFGSTVGRWPNECRCRSTNVAALLRLELLGWRPARRCWPPSSRLLSRRSWAARTSRSGRTRSDRRPDLSTRAWGFGRG